MTNIVPTLSKMSLKILNFEKTLFPALQEELGVLSSKEEKLMRILELAQIELYVSEVKITNPPNHRKEIARAFIAKAVYNLQTTRDLIDRLKVDRVLRIICGWRYAYNIPSESTFSRVFGELARSKIADKTHQIFIKEYLSDTLFFYNSTDSTAIDVREKPLKKEKNPKVKKKRGRKRKDDSTPVVPKAPSLCEKQADMNTTVQMIQSISTSTDIGRKINAKGNGYTQGHENLFEVRGLEESYTWVAWTVIFPLQQFIRVQAYTIHKLPFLLSMRLQEEWIISTIYVIKPTILNQLLHSQKNAGIPPSLMLIHEIAKKQK